MRGELTGEPVARGFHADVVGPLVERDLPGLAYAAAASLAGSAN